MPKIEQKNYSIANKTLEEIIEQVRLILSYEGEVSKVVIMRGNITADYVVHDEGPPYGKIPDSPAESLGDVLYKVKLEEVKNTKELNTDSLGVIASALIQARKSLRVGIAWVISNPDKFKEWLDVDNHISRLLDIPVYQIDPEKLPEDRLILLCGSTYAVSPLKSDFGIILDMGV